MIKALSELEGDRAQDETTAFQAGMPSA